MSLTPGVRVGPYEVLSSIGAGGMGEVCRARDTKLNREVALKVLPDAFAADPDRMSRFQREAQLLAALNHPNIAAIYGLEDDPSTASGQVGVRAIVMELVEGQTLDGPLPIADALPLARQIAEAIEYAHERGIIHRDLKPANIKVTRDGTVKVLDFGLAKAMDDSTDPVANVLATMSPTLSLAATHAGVILGTAAYMAPEQAKGKPADRRADIWAFGVVLYEMLTGAPAFGGDSVPETLASVMKDPIAFGKLPDDTPPRVRGLVARCLERDPRRRLQSIGEARIVLEDAIAGTAVDDSPPVVAGAAHLTKWPWLVAAMAVVVALGAIASAWYRLAPPAPALTRFTLAPPENTTLTTNRPFASTVAVSPNGRYIAFLADESGRARTIWVRAMDSLTAQRLDRTEDAIYPFWSPDSQHIGYFANGKLMRIAVAGGAPLVVADAPDGEGGAWHQPEGQDGSIVFAATQSGPLQRVPAQGGVPTPVTKLEAEENGHIFPQFLPDGRVLYLARGNKPAIYVQSLDSSSRTFLMNSVGRAMFSPPGFLLYLRDNSLLAHRLNLGTLKLEGEPVAIAEDVRSGGTNGRNAFDVSSNGVLAYRGGGSGGNGQVTVYRRDGKADATIVERGDTGAVALSPDDRYLVVIRGANDQRDLWLKDLTTGVFAPLTTTPGPERDPVWSPDSRRVAYIHDEGGKPILFQTTIGSGRQDAIAAESPRTLYDWTPDAKFLLASPGTAGQASVHLLNAPDQGTTASSVAKPQVVFKESYTASQFRVSPDGKWVSYTSQQSGQPEVNVAAFPAFTDRRQISSGGGAQAQWRKDGKELFFLGRDQTLKVMAVNSTASLEFGPAQTLVQAPVGLNVFTFTYAVSREGTRFFVREPFSLGGAAPEQLYIVTHWTSLVGR
jgi:Tol biopolymer transport system component